MRKTGAGRGVGRGGRRARTERGRGPWRPWWEPRAPPPPPPFLPQPPRPQQKGGRVDPLHRLALEVGHLQLHPQLHPLHLQGLHRRHALPPQPLLGLRRPVGHCVPRILHHPHTPLQLARPLLGGARLLLGRSRGLQRCLTRRHHLALQRRDPLLGGCRFLLLSGEPGLQGLQFVLPRLARRGRSLLQRPNATSPPPPPRLLLFAVGLGLLGLLLGRRHPRPQPLSLRGGSSRDRLGLHQLRLDRLHARRLLRRGCLRRCKPRLQLRQPGYLLLLRHGQPLPQPLSLRGGSSRSRLGLHQLCLGRLHARRLLRRGCLRRCKPRLQLRQPGCLLLLRHGQPLPQRLCLCLGLDHLRLGRLHARRLLRRRCLRRRKPRLQLRQPGRLLLLHHGQPLPRRLSLQCRRRLGFQQPHQLLSQSFELLLRRGRAFLRRPKEGADRSHLGLPLRCRCFQHTPPLHGGRELTSQALEIRGRSPLGRHGEGPGLLQLPC